MLGIVGPITQDRSDANRLIGLWNLSEVNNSAERASMHGNPCFGIRSTENFYLYWSPHTGSPQFIDTSEGCWENRLIAVSRFLILWI